MITNSDISGIDRCYFEVLEATSFFIDLRSRNTGHFWHLLYTEANGPSPSGSATSTMFIMLSIRRLRPHRSKKPVHT